MSDEAVTDLTRGVYRRLYSGFTKGQRINKLTLQAEAWFWRVLATVDDFGNGDADPELCHAMTAGRRKVTVKQVSDWLREMKTVGLIRFYDVKGEPYLHVIGFEETQPGGKNGRRIRRFPRPDESEGIQRNPENLSLSSASEIEDEIQIEDDTEKPGSRGKPRSPRSPKTCDEEFLAELQNEEAYKSLDVARVFSKMVAWCRNKGKQPTRSRLINWLNNEDAPMDPRSNGSTVGVNIPSDEPIYIPTDEEIRASLGSYVPK